MQASFGKDGEIAAKGKDANTGTAEGLGGTNISGINDSKAKVNADEIGKDPKEALNKGPITTGRAPIGFDGNTIGTIDDPGRGNTKNAAGNSTVPPKNALPGQTGK